MKKAILSTLLVVIVFLLQATLFAQFNIGGIIPNLLLIVAAALGFLEGRKTGMLIGFLCGILVDITYGSVYGMNALLYLYIGYLNGMFNKVLYPKDMKLPLLLIAGSDLFYGVCFYFFRFMLRGRFEFLYFFIHIIIPEMVYTTVISCFLYPMIHMVKQKLDAKEKEGEQNIA